MDNQEHEELDDSFYYDRAVAVIQRYGDGVSMDPVRLAVLMSELDEEEIQDCMEDYYGSLFQLS